jgi:glyoxylase-like metal-dependent hydrolase (beta-lactamase superfamily II)
VHELRKGLWHWQAHHPDWSADEPWPQEVSSYALDDGQRLLVFDPLALPDELLELAARREPVIVLTSPWHERDAQSLVERLEAPVYTPPADTAQDLMDKFGITAEQAGDGSPDLNWLRSGGGTAHWYAPGDRLPFGIEAFAGRERNDLVLWIESVHAVVAGDTLADFGNGLGMNEWLRGDATREQVVEGLRPLLDLPVELVLPTHGTPAGRDALERALAP